MKKYKKTNLIKILNEGFLPINEIECFKFSFLYYIFYIVFLFLLYPNIDSWGLTIFGLLGTIYIILFVVFDIYFKFMCRFRFFRTILELVKENEGKSIVKDYAI